MPARVKSRAPEFTLDGVVGKEFKTVKLTDYKGKWVVLFFYPLDFTFVCPPEILEFSRRGRGFPRGGHPVDARPGSGHRPKRGGGAPRPAESEDGGVVPRGMAAGEGVHPRLRGVPAAPPPSGGRRAGSSPGARRPP